MAKKGKVENRAIADMLGVHIWTVQRTMLDLEQSGNMGSLVMHKPRSMESAREARTPTFVARIQERIEADPRISMRQLGMGI